jgi:2-haloacid dehalogenase
MRLWFVNLTTYSEALTLAGADVPFTDIGGALLRMLAATRGITTSEACVGRGTWLPPVHTDR